jgi:hypothetical protein
MAPRPGFEPRLDESKSSVLPLHNQGKWWTRWDFNPRSRDYESLALGR